MKKVVLVLAAFLTLGLGNVLAEDNNSNSVRTIKSPRFARPLVEKWIEEYAKTESLAIGYISERQPCCPSLPVVLRQHDCSKAST